jgi:thioester reductase-like protein
MRSVFFTGFPGFLGSELLPRTLERHADDVVARCLVQPKYLALAQKRAGELVRALPSLAGRLEILEGDITRADLGLGSGRSALLQDTVEIFHLAAVYDLAVSSELAGRVNVDGTRNVLELAAACPRLERFHYVSTCYVSGRYAGAFTERDLDKGQSFNNHYEETKLRAELEVQRRMREGLPATIYRPAIVVGDSSTGATQKYDGPYYLIRWIARQRHVALVPRIGDPERTRMNLVPSDFVVNAIAWLAGLPDSRGKVYQLCDPEPLTVGALVDLVASSLGKRRCWVPLPLGLGRQALIHTPWLSRAVQVPPECLDYFALPTHYTCESTLKDLEGSGLRCPPFASYLPRLLDFMLEHPELRSSAMV